MTFPQTYASDFPPVGTQIEQEEKNRERKTYFDMGIVIDVSARCMCRVAMSIDDRGMPRKQLAYICKCNGKLSR